MHFFATSAQIASEFGFDHEVVLETIESLQYPSISEHISMFELGNTSIGQVTEPGYNAVVMNLPLSVGGDDELLLRWKEQFLFNKAPSVQALMNPISSILPASQSAPKSSINTGMKLSISDTARRQSEELISSGELDEIITEPYTTIHREIKSRLNGEDPGYQNVRLYAIARRKILGQ